MKKITAIALSLLLGAVSGWALAAAPVTSMRGADVAAEDQAPDIKDYAGKRPGAQKPIARTFREQPPVIPHAVANFDDINLEENQCLSCHGADTYKKKNAPKIGDSHFLDRDGKKLADVSGLRHNCTQCHVPQVDAPPLVENTFVGNARKTGPGVSAK